jgi:hypothetical protein
MTDILPVSNNELLSTDPAVSVRVSMRDYLHKNEVFHINYAALRETLIAVNAPKDNSNLEIEFGSVVPDDVAGYYDNEDKRIELAHDFEEADLQETLQHELKHYSDFERLPETDFEKIKGTIQDAADTIFPYSATITILSSLKIIGKYVPPVNDYLNEAEILSHIMETTHSVSLPVALGAFALSKLLYRFDKREISARKAEAIKLAPVASTVTL